MEQRDEVRTIQLETLRNRMDRALNESARGEGTDGEAFVQGLLDELILGIGARPMNPYALMPVAPKDMADLPDYYCEEAGYRVARQMVVEFVEAFRFLASVWHLVEEYARIAAATRYS